MKFAEHRDRFVRSNIFINLSIVLCISSSVNERGISSRMRSLPLEIRSHLNKVDASTLGFLPGELFLLKLLLLTELLIESNLL